jgi:hypothetical protein
MPRSFFTVSFTHTDGTFHVSRFFNTLGAARKWAAFIAKGGFAVETTIHRGAAGGELIERKAA